MSEINGSSGPVFQNFIVKYPDQWVISVNARAFPLGSMQWNLVSPYKGLQKSGAVYQTNESSDIMPEVFLQIGLAYKEMVAM